MVCLSVYIVLESCITAERRAVNLVDASDDVLAQNLRICSKTPRETYQNVCNDERYRLQQESEQEEHGQENAIAWHTGHGTIFWLENFRRRYLFDLFPAKCL